MKDNKIPSPLVSLFTRIRTYFIIVCHYPYIWK